jgi:predicted nucleotidyltransferase
MSTNHNKIKFLVIFGSYVRGEAGDPSDVDLVIEFSEALDINKFMDLEERSYCASGAEVDLVTRPALRGNRGNRILQEVVPFVDWQSYLVFLQDILTMMDKIESFTAERRWKISWRRHGSFRGHKSDGRHGRSHKKIVPTEVKKRYPEVPWRRNDWTKG